MKVTRYNPKTKKLPFVKETKDVNVLWCDDGWSYIPQCKIRRKFEVEDDSMEYSEEPWDGVVPGKVLYDEKVVLSVYIPKKMWMEVGQEYAEVYVIDEP